jgi:GNAT superfamily N-acetyltransferase
MNELFEEIYREGLFKKKEESHPMNSSLFREKINKIEKELDNLGLKDINGSGMFPGFNKIDSFDSSTIMKKSEIGKFIAEIYNRYDGTIWCYIEGIEIAPELRKKGIAKAIVNVIINNFKDSNLEFLLQDMSGGFWERMKEEYPKIPFYCY